MSLSEASWIDLEHGGYSADVPLWLELATAANGPVVEFGGGTGRISVHLASHGFGVTTVESDPRLAGALRARTAPDGWLRVMEGDVLSTRPDRSAALVIAPMNFLQSMGDEQRMRSLFEVSREWVETHGKLAVHFTPGLARRGSPGDSVPPTSRAIRRHGVDHALTLIAISTDAGGVSIDWERVQARSGATSAETVGRTVMAVERSSLIDGARSAGWLLGSIVPVPPTGQSAASEILVFDGS